MKSSKISFSSQNSKLIGLIEEPVASDKPMIMLLHGLTNSMIDCPLINEATQTLHAKGFPTFRFDYFGSGQSPGKFSDKTFSILVKNTQDALEFITKRNKRIGVWGRSLGAILGSIICDEPQVFATVLLSTTIRTEKSFSKLFENKTNFSLPIKGTGEIKGKPILPMKFYEETAWVDKEQKRHLSKAKNVLVIQGTEDKIIPHLSWAKEVYSTISKPKQLLFIKGANHAYKERELEAVSQAVMWFEEKYKSF